MENLYLVSISLVVFFIFLLLSKKEKQFHDTLLLFWFTIVLINLVGFYLEQRKQYLFLLEISSAVVFLHGPVLWFYAHSVASEKYKLSNREFAHFIPFAVNIIVVFPWVVQSEFAPFSVLLRSIITMLKILSMIAYMGFTYRFLVSVTDRLKLEFSSLKQKNVTWIKLIAGGYLLIAVLGTISQVLNVVGSGFFINNEDLLVNLVGSFFVIIAGYFGFKQPIIFLASGDQSENDEKIKYSKSKLPSELTQAYWQKINELMKNQMPFLNPDLSLNSLAQQVDISPNHLSQVINQNNLTFYDFINEARIKWVLNRFKQSDHQRQTIESIAMESGFASKASFNRYFKKKVGTTPSNYLKSSK